MQKLLFAFAAIMYCAVFVYSYQEHSPIIWPKDLSMLELDSRASPYYVESDLYVDAGRILIIQPGVKIYFSKGASLIVRGRLIAIGARDRRITFDSAGKNIKWNGIFFDNAEKLNTLSYCNIMNSQGYYSNIASKTADSFIGGAVTISSSSVIMEFCSITKNSADKGGAVYAIESEIFFRGNYFTKNTANEGGVFYLVLCKANLTGNSIYKNEAKNIAGVMLSFGSTVDMYRNRIVENKSQVEGGIYEEDSNIRYRYNNISRNRGKPPKTALVAEILRELPAVVAAERESIRLQMVADKIPEGISVKTPVEELTPEQIKQKLVNSLCNITGKLVLTAKYSPYIIKKDIVIAEKGELEIGPGVALEMAENTGIIVRGRLKAAGKKTEMIYINPANPSKSWKNIIFINTKAENVLECVALAGGGGSFVKIDDNQAVKAGGAVLLINSRLDVAGCSFELNSSSLGGALFAENSKISLANNSFQKNKASLEGGALYIRDSESSITNNDFFDNTSSLDGGAVLLCKTHPDVFDNNIYNNFSKNNGAVFHCRGARPKIRNNQYLKNLGRNFAIEPVNQEIPKRKVVPIF